MHFFKQQLIVKVLGTSLVFLIFTIASHQVFASNVLSATGERISPFWTTHYPQLAVIEKEMPMSNNQISPSQISLVGNITNPFGIRDDILKIIVDTIPADNEAALYHAIRIAQYIQEGFLTDDVNVEGRSGQDMSRAIHCFYTVYLMTQGSDFIRKMDRIRKDTPERNRQDIKADALFARSHYWTDSKSNADICRIGGKY